MKTKCVMTERARARRSERKKRKETGRELLREREIEHGDKCYL